MSNIQIIKKQLSDMKPEFSKALPKGTSVDQFSRILQTAILSNASLMSANKNSLMLACLKAAQSGLMPDGSEAAIVPYQGQARFMPMIRGLVTQLLNSGKVKTVINQVVYTNDEFDHWVDGEGEHILYRPARKDRGERSLAFSMVILTDGARFIEVITMDDVAAVEKVSAARKGPWSGPFKDEMIKKTAFRRLSKKLPRALAPALDRAIEADQEVDLRDLNEPSGPPAEPATEKQVRTPNRLKDAMGIKKKAEPEIQPEQHPEEEEIPLSSEPVGDDEKIIETEFEAVDSSEIPI